MADRRIEARTAFERAHRDLRQAVDTMSADEMGQESANPGWSAKDTLAHLSSIDQRLRGQMQAAVSGQPWAPAEDVDTFNARMVAERRSWTLDQVKAELDQSRDETLALFDGVDDTKLDSYIDHPRRGRQTILDLCSNAAKHIQTHANDIMAARSAK
jgi:uncharacterized damage-inducible protein DinB